MPLIYAVGGIAFAAYLVGIATLPLSVFLGKRLLGFLYRLQYTTPIYPSSKFRYFLHRLVRRGVDVSEYLVPLTEAIMSTYVKAGIPASLSLLYPNEKLLDSLDATALQLWKTHPDQYQEYDRLRAEHDFRLGIWLPLLALGVGLSLLISWWVILPAIVGSLVLLYQTWGLDQRRTVLISNALFQGLVEDTELKSVATVLGALPLPHHWRDREALRCAVTAVAFSKVGDFEMADSFTWDAASSAISDVVPGAFVPDRDVGPLDKKTKRLIDALAEDVRKVYRDNDELDEIPVFDARLKRQLGKVFSSFV